MRFAIPDSESEEEFVVHDTPIRVRASRRTRKSGFGIPASRDRSGSSSSSGSQGSFTSTSDEDDGDAISISSSREDEIDYSFRYRDSTFGKAKPSGSLLSPSLAPGPEASPSKARSPAITRSRTKSSLPKRSLVASKGGLAVREDEWERWERLSREQVMLKTRQESLAFRRDLITTPERTKHASHLRDAEMMTEIQSLLSTLELERAETEKQAKRDFLTRNSILWEGIDRTIAEVKAERQRMLDEQRRAEEQRRRQEEEIQRRQDEERKREAEKRLADEAKRNAEKLERERQQAERARQEAELKQSQAQEQQRIVEANRASAEQNGLTSLQKNEQRWEKWVEHQRKTKTEVIERVKADDGLRKNIGAFKRKITRRIGQIVNTRDSIVNITQAIHEDLCLVLSSQTSAAEPIAFSRELPIGYLYLLSHISKSLLHQAQNEVLAKAEAAFPLAKLVVGLMLRGHAALGEVLIARFVKNCPWVLPFYPAKREDQPQEDYEVSLGYKKGNANEDTVQYSNRMAAIVTLYLAICATDIKAIIPTVFPQPQSQQQLDKLIQANFRTSILWMWLAGICKQPLPALETAPQLMVAALETAGQELVAAYGTRQVGKIVQAILEQGLGPEGAKEGVLAAKALASRQQLRLICEPFMTNGQFPDNPAKFWKV